MRCKKQAALAAARMAAQLALSMAQIKLELGNLAASLDITGQVRNVARSGAALAQQSSASAMDVANSSKVLATTLQGTTFIFKYQMQNA